MMLTTCVVGISLIVVERPLCVGGQPRPGRRLRRHLDHGRQALTRPPGRMPAKGGPMKKLLLLTVVLGIIGLLVWLAVESREA